MYKLLAILSLVLILLTSAFEEAQAAESDTHFRNAYIQLRMRGVGHKLALFLAKTNQAVDESLWTSAFLLSHQRRWYHFMSDESTTNEDVMGLSKKMKFKTTLASRNHPLASFEMMLGLRLGDAQLVGIELHKKTDSYFHAGYSPMFGHMESDHSPDDTSKDLAKWNAYNRAIGIDIKTIANSLDSAELDFETPIRLLSPLARKFHGFQRDLTVQDFQNDEMISDLISKHAIVRALAMKDIQKDKAYKNEAYKLVYGKLVRSGVILPEYNFEDIFPAVLIEDAALSVEEGVKIAIKNEILASILGEKTHFDVNSSPQKDSRMVLYLKSKIDKRTIDLEQSRYRTRLMSYRGAMEEAEMAKREVVGIANTTSEEMALTKIAHADNEVQELFVGLDVKARQFLLTDIFILNSVAKENGGTIDFVSLMKGPNRDQVISNQFDRDQIEASWKSIEMRSLELAALQKADEIAIDFTKDFVPVKFGSYVKVQFGLDPRMRQLEVMMKDELYRTAIDHLFGQNFNNVKSGWVFSSIEGIKRFKRALFRNPTLSYSVYEKVALDRIQEISQELGLNTSSRENAYGVSYSFKSRFGFVIRTAPLMILTGIPFVGDLVMKKLIEYAYKNAKKYQSMNAAELTAAQNSGEFKKIKTSRVDGGLVGNTEGAGPRTCRQLRFH